jgi:hypothetical protein
MAEKKKLSGPDLARGVSLTKLIDGGMLQGTPGESRFSWFGAAAPASLSAQCVHITAPAGHRPHGR